MSTSATAASSIIDELFSLDAVIRYVAIYVDGVLTSRERPGIANTSASESDKYEELIVNPTLLKLVQQRGDIDCGGAKYVLIRYGNFFEYVQPVAGGHVSIGIEAGADLMKTVSAIQALLDSNLG
jgi:hypothetical protein